MNEQFEEAVERLAKEFETTKPLSKEEAERAYLEMLDNAEKDKKKVIIFHNKQIDNLKVYKNQHNTRTTENLPNKTRQETKEEIIKGLMENRVKLE